MGTWLQVRSLVGMFFCVKFLEPDDLKQTFLTCFGPYLRAALGCCLSLSSTVIWEGVPSAPGSGAGDGVGIWRPGTAQTGRGLAKSSSPQQQSGLPGRNVDD